MGYTTRPVRLDNASIEILDRMKGRLVENGKRRPTYNDAVRLLAGETILSPKAGTRGREVILIPMSAPASWVAPRLRAPNRRR